MLACAKTIFSCENQKALIFLSYPASWPDQIPLLFPFNLPLLVKMFSAFLKLLFGLCAHLFLHFCTFCRKILYQLLEKICAFFGGEVHLPLFDFFAHFPLLSAPALIQFCSYSYFILRQFSPKNLRLPFWHSAVGKTGRGFPQQSFASDSPSERNQMRSFMHPQVSANTMPSTVCIV